MRLAFTCVILALLLFSCGSKQETITWKSIERSLQTQLITANDGDTITIAEGNYMFTKGLLMEGKKNVVIRGAGMDKTVLSFKNQQEGAQGIYVSNGSNITLQDFTIQDAKGDNLKVSDTKGVTLRRIRSLWTGEPSNANGAYALYPVLCKRLLLEECEAIGSSDAGIYVGQSDTVIIRNNKAHQNVAGIESENSRWVEIYGNEAYDNSGGLLIFDLPGLTQYGHTTKVYQNNIHDNNHDNFATPGNVVASIPPGTGIMILATHDLELTDNDVTDNASVGTGIISYELVAAINEGVEQQENAIGGVQAVDNRFKEDTLYNAFPYRIYIHHNRYKNSHWFPSLDNDIGKLLAMKSMFNPPDVLFDGIQSTMTNREICVRENGKITFIDLDAGNDFKNFSKDPARYDCEGVKIF